MDAKTHTNGVHMPNLLDNTSGRLKQKKSRNSLRSWQYGNGKTIVFTLSAIHVLTFQRGVRVLTRARESPDTHTGRESTRERDRERERERNREKKEEREGRREKERERKKERERERERERQTERERERKRRTDGNDFHLSAEALNRGEHRLQSVAQILKSQCPSTFTVQRQ